MKAVIIAQVLVTAVGVEVQLSDDAKITLATNPKAVESIAGALRRAADGVEKRYPQAKAVPS